MARLNYTLLDKFLLTLTSRIDGSSRLAEGNKYATFPSVALGWRVIDDAAGQKLGPLSSLKLRGSYGTTGNTSVDPYQTQGSLNRTTYAFGCTAALRLSARRTLATRTCGGRRRRRWMAAPTSACSTVGCPATVDVYRANTNDLLLDRAASAVDRLLADHAERRRDAQHRCRARPLGDHARRLARDALDERHHLRAQQERDRHAERR